MVGITFAHSYFVKLGNIEPKSDLHEKLGKGKAFIGGLLAMVFVDMFFIMSAILTTRTVLKFLRR